MTGRDMVGAALGVYGPRTTLIVYNTNKKVIEEWTLREDEKNEQIWVKT